MQKYLKSIRMKMAQIVSNCNNSALLRKIFLSFSRWLYITERSPMHWKTLRFCERNVRETRFKFCHFFPVQNRVKIISYMDRRHQGDLKNGIFHTLKTNRSGKTLTFWSAKWHFFVFSNQFKYRNGGIHFLVAGI